MRMASVEFTAYEITYKRYRSQLSMGWVDIFSLSGVWLGPKLFQYIFGYKRPLNIVFIKYIMNKKQTLGVIIH